MTLLNSVLKDPLAIIRTHRRAFIVLSAASVAAFLLGILLTVFVPALRPGGLGSLQGATGTPGVGSLIVDAYRSRSVPIAILVTLAVNLFLASLLQTTVPTLIVPFLGIALTLVRSLSWGILFTPAGAEDPRFLIHWVTLVIEGSAYLVVGFAAWVQGSYFLQPKRFGFASRGAGYKAGLAATLRLYVLVVILLIVGAIYESITVIYFIA